MAASGSSKWLTREPVPVVLAIVIVFALIVLALLRHFFGSIAVQAGTR